MGSPYTGQAVPPPGQDAPPPLAGSAPAPVLVVDSDAPVAASFTPAPKSLADHIAWIQKLLNGAPASVFTTGAVPGFSSVAKTGTAGTGTIAPTAAASTVAQPTNGAVSVAIKISTGGAAGGGVAQFQWSNDGGATYGTATNLPSGNYTDGTSGITVTFAGPFGAGDIYTFQPLCQPQLALKDSGGKIRHVVDHNGYPMGRRSEFREDWFYAGSGSPGASPPYMILSGPSGSMVLGAGASGGSRWQVNGTASVGSVQGGGNSTTGANAMLINSGTVNGNKTWLQQTGNLFTKTTKTVFVAEWDVYLSSVGANNVLVYHGIMDGYATPSSSTNRIYFSKASTDMNWQWNTASASGNTGVAPVANTWQRFRIEIHGSGSPLGAAVGSEVALFFINEKLVATTSSGLPLGGSFMFCNEVTAGLGGPVTLGVGPLLATASRVYGDIDSMPGL